ncbi:CLUMA_CG001236, isoform A [Clunio marinus]|uniref:Migration and invasion enhancer 1 n=1 Tax=Clunio marinus TaxID=568069 RepID=A0A1J1HHR8_9DIPT|nr:CLUMA_CG001236, isoform A [Clunio marinus]
MESKLNEKHKVNVDIEYCGVCDFKRQCNELKTFLENSSSDADVSCTVGRRGAFEVKINNVLVHSKLQTIAFPDHQDIADNVKLCKEGKEMKSVKQQTITDCCIS